MHAFKVVPKRWVVERSFAWLDKNRRLWKNCERLLNTSLQFIHLAFLGLPLGRAQTRPGGGAGATGATSQGKRMRISLLNVLGRRCQRRAASKGWPCSLAPALKWRWANQPWFISST